MTKCRLQLFACQSTCKVAVAVIVATVNTAVNDAVCIWRCIQTFAISNVTGEVLVIGEVDRERQSVCVLTVVAVDVARPSTALAAYSRLRVVVSDVNDNAPRLTLTTLSPPGGRWAEVRDGAAPGAFLAHVAVTDPDTGNASVVDCAVNSTEFRLTPIGAGDYQLTTAVAFGRGHEPLYVVAVTCVDRGRPPLSDFRSLSVLVVDAGPRFAADAVTARVAPGAAPGTPVVRLNATATDVGPEAEIVYTMSLVAGRVDALAVGARSGWVTTRVVIGRDAVNATLVYLVTATDGGQPPLSAVTTLRVHVVDDDDASATGISTTRGPLLWATGDAAGGGDDVGSDVIIASVVCATIIVLAIIAVVAVAFCVRRRWCVGKGQSCCSSRHSSGQTLSRHFALHSFAANDLCER